MLISISVLHKDVFLFQMGRNNQLGLASSHGFHPPQKNLFRDLPLEPRVQWKSTRPTWLTTSPYSGRNQNPKDFSVQSPNPPVHYIVSKGSTRWTFVFNVQDRFRSFVSFLGFLPSTPPKFNSSPLKIGGNGRLLSTFLLGRKTVQELC